MSSRTRISIVSSIDSDDSRQPSLRASISVSRASISASRASRSSMASISFHQFGSSKAILKKKKKRRPYKKKQSKLDEISVPSPYDMPGVKKLTLSEITQKIVECVVGKIKVIYMLWTR